MALLTLFCLSFSSQLYSQAYEGKQKDIDQILKNAEMFSKYYVENNLEKLVASYTSDGKVFPGNTDIIDGTDGLTKFWRRPDDRKVLSHKITPVELKVIKRTAYDYGYYEGVSLNAEGEEVPFKGKYVIVWKKVGSDWKIYLAIWNRV